MQWVDVKEFPGYEVHPELGVRRKGKNDPLKARRWLGYPKVTLMRDGKKHEVRVHRIVADHFVPNPNGKPIVNHKDANRENFVADNLEWVDNSENQKHRWRTAMEGLKKKKYRPEYTIIKTAENDFCYNAYVAKGDSVSKCKELKKAIQKAKAEGLYKETSDALKKQSASIPVGAVRGGAKGTTVFKSLSSGKSTGASGLSFGKNQPSFSMKRVGKGVAIGGAGLGLGATMMTAR